MHSHLFFWLSSFILYGGSIGIFRRIHIFYVPFFFFKARLCLSSFTVEALTYLMHSHMFFCFVFHPSWWKHWHISTHSHCLHAISFFLACLCLPSFTVEAWTYLLHSHRHSHYRYRYSVSCRVFSVAASQMSSKSREHARQQCCVQCTLFLPTFELPCH